MCRSIKLLNAPGQAVTDGELQDAARQFVRKISGFRKPSRANQEAFERAVREIAESSERLLAATKRAVVESPNIRTLLLLVTAALCGAPSVFAQQTASGDDAMEILLAVRKNVMQTVDRLPRYLCTETVDRSTFRPEEGDATHSCDELASRRKRANWEVRRYTSDRLRVDVAVSSDSEMYSWVGENIFKIAVCGTDQGRGDVDGGFLVFSGLDLRNQ